MLLDCSEEWSRNGFSFRNDGYGCDIRAFRRVFAGVTIVDC